MNTENSLEIKIWRLNFEYLLVEGDGAIRWTSFGFPDGDHCEFQIGPAWIHGDVLWLDYNGTKDLRETEILTFEKWSDAHKTAPLWNRTSHYARADWGHIEVFPVGEGDRLTGDDADRVLIHAGIGVKPVFYAREEAAAEEVPV